MEYCITYRQHLFYGFYPVIVITNGDLIGWYNTNEEIIDLLKIDPIFYYKQTIKSGAKDSNLDRMYFKSEKEIKSFLTWLKVNIDGYLVARVLTEE